MKNNTLQKKQDSDRFLKSSSVCSFCLLAGLLSVQSGHAQFYNEGKVSVEKETIMSVYENYENAASGNFTNDGLVYIFKDWTNNGDVNFTPAVTKEEKENGGKTFFIGDQIQKINGSATAPKSSFQNIIFSNLFDLTPFKLETSITVNNNSEFEYGIVDVVDTINKMVFNEEAYHTKTSDNSFVDGKVQKLGNGKFEFPVGDELRFRPSYNDAGTNQAPYTTQYFYKNSGDIHSHSNKEETIKLINNAEYWNVTKDEGSEKIVLSLSIDERTTPSEFFNLSENQQIVIVRWDMKAEKWVNEGGVVSDKPSEPEASAGAEYQQLVTTRVRGYGMFTLAIADKVTTPDDDLIVYNGISPNDDGKNDSFLIKGIAKYPDNEVEIYNRWGVKVYDAKGYNESDKMFRGYSDGRATINRGEKLPTGTYFYILKYNNGKKGIEKSGYLYISNQ